MMKIDAKICNFAHRGARSLAPENTLIAAQKGWETGADAWELDVAMTSDGEMVVIHDDTLSRTSNAKDIYPDRAPWDVHTFTLAELQTLDFGSWFLHTDPFGQIAAGNVSLEEQTTYRNIRIPTLHEALEFTKGHRWRVNVELKDLTGKPGDRTIVENAVAMIKKMKMEDAVLISSFNHIYLQRVKRLDPEIDTAALVEEAAPDPVALLNQLGARAYNPSIEASNAVQFSALRNAAKDIYIWTVNDEATMQSLIAIGATGLFTDFPQRLKNIVNNC